MAVDISVYDDFFQAVDILININNKRKKDFEDMKKTISLLEWLENFSTVKIDIGRCVGKTTYISRRADLKSDIIVVPMRYSKRFFPENIRPICLSIDELPRKIEQIRSKVSKVYVDEPSLIYKQLSYGRIVDNIYPICDYNTTIIYLGK